MARWTESAKAEWKQYSRRLHERLKGSDIDAAEVEEDLKRHVDEEIQAAGVTVVDSKWLRSLLRRIGDLELAGEAQDREEAGIDASSVGAQVTQPEDATPSYIWLLIASVLWPLATLLFELSTRLCSGYLFDPIPTVWHGLMLFSIPIGNLWAWVVLRSNEGHLPRYLPFWLAFNIGISLIYAVLMIPAIPFGLVMIIYFGAGLLPLTPLATLFSGIAWWRHCMRSMAHCPPYRHTLSLGMLTALLISVALETPNLITRVGLRWADSEVTAVQVRGVRWLRSFGDRDIMLKACYERPRRIYDFSAWLAQVEEPLTQEDARHIFYQVTGQPFNAVPPPKLYTQEGRWNIIDEDFTWEFDNALGGTQVAGRVRGLKMISSRLDGRIETAAATAYTEWTMEFENQSSRAREARAQIRLPAGGVVSRLTLWVNGEEREAAFASRAKTREAYQKIAVERRRDPVLVTTSGPDQVLVQCFPVPADGGKMKIRFGITAPLDMVDLEQGRVRLPAMVERNFNLKDDLEHSVWLESRSPLSGDSELFHASRLREGDHTLQAMLTDRALLESASSVTVRRPESTAQVWTEALQPDHVVIQELKSNTPQPVSSVVVVVDGSLSMKPYFESLGEALSALESIGAAQVVVASDQEPFMDEDGNPVEMSLAAARESIAGTEATGGQDNLAALVHAWDLALQSGASHLWWLHGPQPVLLGDVAPLLQRMERSRGRIQLMAYGMEPGPNRVLEAVDGWHARLVHPYEGLKSTFEQWALKATGQASEYVFERSHLAREDADGLDAMPEVSRHIERLWAKDQVERLRGKRQIREAVHLAATQQLVTPVTGAVVLETEAQYTEMGLHPVSADTVPSIPEPGTLVLCLLGVAAFLVRGRLVARRI